MSATFEDDIKPMLRNYVGCMRNVVLGDDEGTENLLLDDYEIVKRFSFQIQVAIHGYDYDDDGALRPGATPLLVESGEDVGQPVVAAHPMPPGGADSRLPQKAIDNFDEWVRSGMPES